jgi:hypothetical protein
MAAPKGNKYWQLADPSKLGRNPIFKTPEILEEKVFEYFKWVDENPIISKKTTVSDKGTFTNTDTLQRPYTWDGLYVFLDVYDLEHYKTKQEFSNIITRIDRIIKTQKFEGASVGIFNSNIIARDLGLKENVDNTTNGKEINITPTINVYNTNEGLSDEQIE